MSDSRKADIRLSLPGDWWYFAAAFHEAHRADRVGIAGHGTGNVYTYAVAVRPEEQYTPAIPLGEILFTSDGNYTQVYITFSVPSAEPFWRGVESFLRKMAALARAHRQEAIGTTPDEIIEYYYRSRAAGGKVTLTQLAEQAGLSYSYITKAKMKYDRAGKWGSRVKETVKDGT